DLYVRNGLDRRCKKAYLTRSEFTDLRRKRAIYANCFDEIFTAGIKKPYLRSFPDHSVYNAEKNDHAAVCVVPTIKNKSFQRSGWIAFRRRNVLDYLFEDLLNADACFCRGKDGMGGIEADDRFDLFLDPFRFGRGQVDLVQYGDQF